MLMAWHVSATLVCCAHGWPTRSAHGEVSNARWELMGTRLRVTSPPKVLLLDRFGGKSMTADTMSMVSMDGADRKVDLPTAAVPLPSGERWCRRVPW